MGKLPHKSWFNVIKVSTKATKTLNILRIGHFATPEHLHRIGVYNSPNFSCSKIGSIRHIVRMP